MKTAKVCLYQSSGLLQLAVRHAIALPGQSLDDVPSHCSIMFGDTWEYEAIVTGVHCRRHTEAAWREYSVDLPRMEDAEIFAMRQEGKPYDFGALAFDLFGRGTPHWVKLQDMRDDRWDCSRLVVAALERGGFFHGWHDAARLPETPNDINIMLQERATL